MRFRKICIIHLNQIGDLVFSLPLVKTLKDNLPNSSIHSIIKPSLQELLLDSPFVDRILLRENSLNEKFELLKKIRHNRYDLLICLGRSEESLLLSSLSNAKLKVGFAHFPWDLGLDIKEPLEGHNSWNNYAKLLRLLDIRISKNDYVGLLNINGNVSLPYLPEKFVVIAPAASRRRQMKTWDPAKFAELIILLQQHYQLGAILVGSLEDQVSNKVITAGLKERAPENPIGVIDLTGKTGLRQLCLILQQARLFVGIDSGVMHLASSLDIPVVGLFGPTDPRFVGPQNSRSRVVNKDDMDCLPCYLKPCDHRNCMNELGVDTVLEACRQVMSESGD